MELGFRTHAVILDHNRQPRNGALDPADATAYYNPGGDHYRCRCASPGTPSRDIRLKVVLRCLPDGTGLALRAEAVKGRDHRVAHERTARVHALLTQPGSVDELPFRETLAALSGA